MFRSGIIQFRNDASPMCSTSFHLVKKDIIFFRSPLTFFDSLIEVILPPFPALFGGLKELAIWLKEKIFGYFIPFSFFELSIWDHFYL